jgi:hypothetical protein
MSYIEHGGSMEPVQNDVPARIDSLENRVRHLEVITGEIRAKVDSMADNMATKADIAMLMAEMAQQKAYVSDRLEQHLRLVLVTLAGSLIAGITIMTFVLNYASPPRQAAFQPPPQPIIITVPSRN